MQYSSGFPPEFIQSLSEGWELQRRKCENRLKCTGSNDIKIERFRLSACWLQYFVAFPPKLRSYTQLIV